MLILRLNTVRLQIGYICNRFRGVKLLFFINCNQSNRFLALLPIYRCINIQMGLEQKSPLSFVTVFGYNGVRSVLSMNKNGYKTVTCNQNVSKLSNIRT